MISFFLSVGFWLTYVLGFRLGRAHALRENSELVALAQTILAKAEAERRRTRDLVASLRRSAGEL